MKIHPIREELNIVYGRAGGEDLQLDLYVPKDATEPVPAVVLLHGGGWTCGSHEGFRPWAAALAAQGYVAASVGYRLAPRYKFPAQIQDAKCAVRWLRANRERYQIDSDHIAALGHSAGGHLALLLGLTDAADGLEGEGGNPEQSSQVQAVINLAGPADLAWPEWPNQLRAIFCDFLGGTREQIPDTYRSASPVSHIRRGGSPVLTIHGTKDQVVPYEQAELLHTALRKARVRSRLIPVHGGDHGAWNGKQQQRLATAILDFLEANFGKR